MNENKLELFMELKREITEFATSRGLTLYQLFILGNVKKGLVTAKQIIDEHMEKFPSDESTRQNMKIRLSQETKILIKSDLLVKSKDPNDGRIQLFSLTNKAEEIMKE